MENNQESVRGGKNLSTQPTEFPRPASVSIPLDSVQLFAVKTLYDGRDPENNGGVTFGVLGEAVIDEHQEDYGTAKFYWLNAEQYAQVRAAIKDAMEVA